MTDRHEVRATIGWMRQGTEAFLTAVDKLRDDELGLPSRLPGWSRAHLIGHVSRNAEALSRLGTWARTGVESPMYVDRTQRAAEIETSAAHTPTRLRRELVSTASDLDEKLDALDDGAWQTEVRSALGRVIPAAEIPWLRCREVWLHTVDLGTGATTAQLPPDLVDVLLDDVTMALSSKDSCPEATLRATDRARSWALGGGDPGRELAGPAAELAGWLTGRSTGEELNAGPRGIPEPPIWL